MVDPTPFDDIDVDGSIDDVAAAEWQSESTAFERIETVLRRTREFETAGTLADRALVSEPTARKHLESLVESGRASATTLGGATQYRRNPDQRRLERVRQLADEHTRPELESAIREMKTRIRSYEDEYGATSPEELVSTLDPDDEEGWETVSQWKSTRRNLAFARTALAYTETRRLDAIGDDDDATVATEEYA
ncbi:DUF7342 family protein [Halovivax cerinus]|uniref:ArsR family transcriptional regulator n=1 Tax=Halovivax cerinus TaxID=1487865 RepID=A0ABD5NRI5_9EURY|nr:ArsR family transcriptional regulator [Halovivax cerinus]